MANKIENKYIELARKLGKLPSRREMHNLAGVYIDSFGQFKTELLKKHPELEELSIPVKLTQNDVESYRLGVLKENSKSNNQNLIEKTSNLEYIAQFAEKFFVNKIKTVKPFSSKSKTERALNIVLSDLHFGADVKKEETGVANYGTVEESRRLAYIVQEVINYKAQHRDSTELNVMLIGDLIQNQLHDARDGAPLAEQIIRAIHLLSQALLQFSANFKKVNVYCSGGNHGRIGSRHKHRAVNQKWDSHETIIAYALKTALKPQSNVSFHIPKTPYGTYEVFGEKILYTHGDTFINVGFPGSSIPNKAIETQINKINASLPDTKEFKVCVVGHVHTASQTYLSNGCIVMTNGALISPDEFAVSIGIVEAQSGQMLFESYPGFAVGDVRYIRVNSSVDSNVKLDKVIKPFKSLND